MALKVKISQSADDVVGKGTIDGIVPFYYKDQGHRWMVRIGNQWTFKQRDLPADALPSIPTAARCIGRSLNSEPTREIWKLRRFCRSTDRRATYDLRSWRP